VLVERQDLQLVDRSTLRTSTPGGTCSSAGAKFRTLVMPASTSRSQTACAAAAGVAMTPIERPGRRTTSASSSRWRTTSPLTCSPTRAGSTSKSPTTRKPRSSKPP
jgi:hypothetical protein